MVIFFVVISARAIKREGYMSGVANASFANIDLGMGDLLALGLSTVGLVIGIRLAFSGRLAKGRWARIVEAIVVMVLTSIVTNLFLLATGQPPQPQIAAGLGVLFGAIAFFLSGRYRRTVYGMAGAAIAGSMALGAMMFVPFIDLFGIGALVVGAAAIIGFMLGERAHRWILVIGTAIGGAQWASTSLIGLIQVPRDKSWSYLGDRVLDYIAPVFNLVIGLLTETGIDRALIVLGLALLAAVFVSGFGYQMSKINVTAAAPASFKEWMLEPLRRWTLPAVIAVCAYAAVLLYVRALPRLPA